MPDRLTDSNLRTLLLATESFGQADAVQALRELQAWRAWGEKLQPWLGDQDSADTVGLQLFRELRVLRGDDA